MRLVTQTEVLAPVFGEEQTIRILANSGFDAIDWSFFAMLQDDNPWCQPDWRERALRMKAVAEECGIGFSQSRAERALFASASDAGAVGARMARDLASAGVRSVRWAVVRI